VVCLSLLSGSVYCSGNESIELSGFGDIVKHWNDKYGRDRQDETWSPDQTIDIADNLLTYQVKDGGWPKSYNPLLNVPETELRTLLGKSLQHSTLDNRTTWPHIIYLAKVYTASGEERFKAGAERGLDYIFREQRSTGGWRGADIDAVTYNDDVMFGVMRLLRDIRRMAPCFDWLDDARRTKAEAALDRAIDVTLKCQIVVNGVKTAWCQQHSHRTFEPVKARSYELPSICPVESTGIVRFLMQIDAPPPRIVEAIEAAVLWIDQSKISGIRVKDIKTAPVRFEFHSTSRDRIVVDDSRAPPIWTRYYEIDTNRPFFCNRDGIKVYALAEVHREQRTGYNWYSDVPRQLLEIDYPAWKAKSGTSSASPAADSN
jgi:PelA/Pel-15E family pectate lyase